jgi:hypothetical protein
MYLIVFIVANIFAVCIRCRMLAGFPDQFRPLVYRTSRIHTKAMIPVLSKFINVKDW